MKPFIISLCVCVCVCVCVWVCACHLYVLLGSETMGWVGISTLVLLPFSRLVELMNIDWGNIFAMPMDSLKISTKTLWISSCATVYKCVMNFKVLYFLSCWSNAPLSWWKRTEMHSSHPLSLPALVYSFFPMRNHVCNFNESSNIWSWLFTCDVFLYLCIYKGDGMTWDISNENDWKHICCVILSKGLQCTDLQLCHGITLNIKIFNMHAINTSQISNVFNEEHPVLHTLLVSSEDHPTLLEKTDLPSTLKHPSGFSVICSASHESHMPH